MRDSEHDGVKNVDAALEIIEYLASSDQQLGVREAARILDMPKSTVHRIFSSLLAKGVVKLDERSKQYQLDFGIVRLCHGFLENNDLISASSPILRTIRDDTDETVCLNVRVGFQSIPVLQFESREPIRWTLRVGVPQPLNLGAGGKLLLAFSDFADQTIVNQFASAWSQMKSQQFLEELKTIRDKRYAVSHAELNPGVTALSVPIFSHREVVAGIGLYGLDSRITDSVISSYLDKMFKAASQISHMLAG